MKIAAMVIALIAAPLFMRDLLKSNLDWVSKLMFGTLLILNAIDRVIAVVQE